MKKMRMMRMMRKRRRIPQRDKQGGEQQLKSGMDCSYRGVYVDHIYLRCHTSVEYNNVFKNAFKMHVMHTVTYIYTPIFL